MSKINAVVDDVKNDLEIEKIDRSQKDIERKQALPPAQPPWLERSMNNTMTCHLYQTGTSEHNNVLLKVKVSQFSRSQN